MAKDRAGDSKRVFANPISHVNVLPNLKNAGPDDGNMGYGNDMSFKKNWRDKKFSDASGTVRYKAEGRNESQSADVFLRGAVGTSRDLETANAARKEAYNEASSEAVSNRKEKTKKSAAEIESRNKGKKAKVVKVRS